MGKLDVNQLQQKVDALEKINRDLQLKNNELKDEVAKKGGLADKLADWWTGTNNITRTVFILLTLVVLFGAAVGIASLLNALLPDTDGARILVGLITAGVVIPGFFIFLKALRKII